MEPKAVSLVNRFVEGAQCQPGINWTRDKASTFLCHIILWKLCITFRIRSEYITNGGAPFKSWWHRFLYKYRLWFAWDSDPHIGIIKYRFYAQTFGIGEHWVTCEQLIDFIETQGKKNDDVFNPR